jgi:hypothetical protein
MTPAAQRALEGGNRLIAEFMGWAETEENIFTVPHPFPLFSEEDYTYKMRSDQLEFNTSWDWLMPVVQKILKEDAGMNTYQLYVCDSLGTADIGAVYNAVIQFIQWYSTNKHLKK